MADDNNRSTLFTTRSTENAMTFFTVVGFLTIVVIFGYHRFQATGTWQEVERVCIFSETAGTIAGFRDSAMIRLMSDCLLRVSEVVAVNCGDLKKSILAVHVSKTDPEGSVKRYMSAMRREMCFPGIATLQRLPAGQ